MYRIMRSLGCKLERHHPTHQSGSKVGKAKAERNLVDLVVVVTKFQESTRLELYSVSHVQIFEGEMKLFILGVTSIP